MERLHGGVYGFPNTADLPFAAETAALLAFGEGAVLSHHSAATLWGSIVGRYATRVPLPDRMAFSFTVPHDLFNQAIVEATRRALEPAECEFFVTLPRR